MPRVAVCDNDTTMPDSLSAKISDCFGRGNTNVCTAQLRY